jgi:uncharacterized membrane protein YvlD (DUF360 family)
MTSDFAGWKIHALVFLSFAVLAMTLYFGSIQPEFLSDDWRRIASPWSISSPESRFFRPVTDLFFFLGLKLFGRDASGFHVLNILLHALNSFLLFCLAGHIYLHVVKLPAKLVFALSLFSGLTFLALARHSEAVAWLSGSTDVLCCLFLLSSLLSYLRFRQSRRRFYMALSLLSFLSSILAKEAALFLPFLVLLLELINPLGLRLRAAKRIPPALGFFAVLAAYLVFRVLFMSDLKGYGVVHYSFDLNSIGRVTLPYHLLSIVPNTPRFDGQVLGLPVSVLAAGLALLVVAIVWLRKSEGLAPVRRRDKIIPMTLGAFILSLAPVVSLPVSFLTFQGERFTYIPSVFISLLTVCVLHRLLSGLRWELAVLGAACFGLLSVNAAALARRNLAWKSSAQITRRILDRTSAVVAENRARRLLFLAFPDSIDDAYCFRNGLAQALKLLLGRDLQVHLGLPIHIAHPLKNIFVRSVHLSSSPIERYAVRTNSLFTHLENKESAAGGFRLTATGENALELEADPSVPLLILYFSEGKVRVLRNVRSAPDG